MDHELRLTPFLQATRQALRDGVIGNVLFIQGAVILPKDPQAEWSWWQDEACGGGALNAIGSHLIDAMRFILDGWAGAELSCKSQHRVALHLSSSFFGVVVDTAPLLQSLL